VVQLPKDLLAKTFGWIGHQFMKVFIFIANLVMKLVTFIAHLPGAHIVAKIAFAFCDMVEYMATTFCTALEWLWWCIIWMLWCTGVTLAGVLATIVVGFIWWIINFIFLGCLFDFPNENSDRVSDNPLFDKVIIYRALLCLLLQAIMLADWTIGGGYLEQAYPISFDAKVVSSFLVVLVVMLLSTPVAVWIFFSYKGGRACRRSQKVREDVEKGTPDSSGAEKQRPD